MQGAATRKHRKSVRLIACSCRGQKENATLGQTFRDKRVSADSSRKFRRSARSALIPPASPLSSRHADAGARRRRFDLVISPLLYHFPPPPREFTIEKEKLPVKLTKWEQRRASPGNANSETDSVHSPVPASILLSRCKYNNFEAGATSHCFYTRAKSNSKCMDNRNLALSPFFIGQQRARVRR